MTIKQQGGIFGRNPTFNDVEVEGSLTVGGSSLPDTSTILVDSDIGSTVQGYDANTAKYDDATANFTGTLQEGGNNVVTADEVGTIASQDADSVNIDGGAIDGVTLGTNSAVTDARIDNIKIDGNAITTTNTDGDLLITPDGAGSVGIGPHATNPSQAVFCVGKKTEAIQALFGVNDNALTDPYIQVQGRNTANSSAYSANFGVHADSATAFMGLNGGTDIEVNSSGNLLVGGASASAMLSVQAASSDEAGYFRPNVIDNGSGSEPVTVKVVSQKNACLDLNRYYSFGGIVTFRQNNDAVGSISVTSTATTYNTSSDYRLKENVTDLTGAIDRLQQLNPKRFNFTADPNTTVDGFLAHEAATAVPEAVTGAKDATQAIGDITDADGNVVKTGVPQVNVPDGHTWTATGTEPVYQGIDQSKLVPLLVAALQEAVARIEALENA